MMRLVAVLSAAVSLGFLAFPVHADTFGSGGNQFVIDFVSVGNAGNGDDAGAGGGIYYGPYGGVAYDYRISTYEISQAMIDKATALGMANVVADAWTGNRPAANVTWYEAAAFVNWLNVDRGYHAAYDLTYSGGWSMSLWGASDQASTGVDSGTNPYRHKDAFYFLPSVDEWYKAAYHQNDGVTANYWDYQNGGNAAPDGIDFAGDPDFEMVIKDPYDQGGPNEITDAGSSPSAYGTHGQGGNVWEWHESAHDAVNDSSSERRTANGGCWENPYNSTAVFATSPNGVLPQTESILCGIRVASVIPEPTTFTMLTLGSLALVMGRRRK